MNSKVIYKFKCNICNDVYICETIHHFLVREYEHLGKSILAEKNLKYTEKDAIAIKKNCHNHSHTADISCFSLVGTAANKYHPKLKESLLILKLKPSLNVARESYLKMYRLLFENVGNCLRKILLNSKYMLVFASAICFLICSSSILSCTCLVK